MPGLRNGCESIHGHVSNEGGTSDCGLNNALFQMSHVMKWRHSWCSGEPSESNTINAFSPTMASKHAPALLNARAAPPLVKSDLFLCNHSSTCAQLTSPEVLSVPTLLKTSRSFGGTAKTLVGIMSVYVTRSLGKACASTKLACRNSEVAHERACVPRKLDVSYITYCDAGVP